MEYQLITSDEKKNFDSDFKGDCLQDSLCHRFTGLTSLALAARGPYSFASGTCTTRGSLACSV
jgi:hypothetical protein